MGRPQLSRRGRAGEKAALPGRVPPCYISEWPEALAETELLV